MILRLVAILNGKARADMACIRVKRIAADLHDSRSPTRITNYTSPPVAHQNLYEPILFRSPNSLKGSSFH